MTQMGYAAAQFVSFSGILMTSLLPNAQNRRRFAEHSFYGIIGFSKKGS
jgi:hypothetical protein